LIQGGKLKALAVSTAKRSSALPNIPTTVESGVANSDFVFWVGLIAPAGTPPAIVKRINDEVIKALNNNEVKERFVKLGAEAMPMTPDGFNQFIKSEMDVAGKISKAANLKAN
jgi:tripartite-type tricarboxylate transporter receptor subunit TctC